MTADNPIDEPWTAMTARHDGGGATRTGRGGAGVGSRGVDLDGIARSAFRLAYRILGNRTDAEDVSQDVLVRLLSRGRRLRRSGNPEGWIHRVTVNRCMDVFRDRRRSVDLDVERLDEAVNAVDETGGDFRRLLRLLTPRERVAAALVLGEGLATREAAGAMGCRQATVRVLCHRARRKMRKALAVGERR